jgi:hypothetical protein
MSQDAQVNQLCSIIPMLNTTIQRQNAIIDKLVESLDQKNKELGQMDAVLAEIKTIKDDIKNVKQELKDDLKTEISCITLSTPVLKDEPVNDKLLNDKPASNNDPTSDSKPMSKRDLIAANMQLKISPDILSKMVKQIRCLYIGYDSGELIYGVSLDSRDYMQEFAKTFNLVRSVNYDWNNISVKDMFTHGNSSFVVPYKWLETYFPNEQFKTKFELSALRYIRSDIFKTEIDTDVITVRFEHDITNAHLYDIYAKSLSTTYNAENGTIKLSIKQYADLLEETK